MVISFLRLKKPANQAVLEKRDNPPSVSVKRNKLTELLSFWVVADVRRAGLRDSVVYPGESQSDRIWQKFLARHIDSNRSLVLSETPPPPSGARPTSLRSVLYFGVELPERYHSLPIKQWRKVMRANRKSYATAAVRAWLRGRHKIRLQQQPFSMVA
jgi:hypothetical protein